MAEKENKKVIIAHGSEENRQYWSLSNYGRATWKHKWWVLGSAVVVGLACFLVVRLAVNPSKQVASSKYSYNLATEKDDDGTVRYLSGEIFNFTDIISEENLTAVKESNETYASINVARIIKDNGISVAQNEINEKKPNEETTYTLKVNAKYFASEDQMRSYVKDVISSLQEKSNEAIKSFTVDKVITTNFSTLEFDQQIITLNNQYNNIEATYDELSDKFTTSAKLDDGSLSEAIAKFKESYKEGSDTIFTNLSAEMVERGYAYIPSNWTIDEKVGALITRADNYKASLKNNVKSRNVYADELKSLTTATVINNASTEYTKKVVELSDNIAKINVSNAGLIESLRVYGYKVGNTDPTALTITDVDGFIYDSGDAECQKGIIYKLSSASDKDAKKAECIAFGNTLKEKADRLLDDIETANKIHHYLYNAYNNKVNFYTSGVVELSGGMSSTLIAGIGAVVALAASSLIVTAIEISKEKEAEASK